MTEENLVAAGAGSTEGQREDYLVVLLVGPVEHLAVVVQQIGGRNADGVQSLLGFERFTRYGVKTDKGEVVLFAVEPTNISVMSKTNVEIELAKTTGASPIQSLAFTNVGSSETNMEQSPLYNNTEGLLLTTSYQPLQGYMAPIGMTEFTLVSQYDVYDTNGNLIRENQTAENKINVNSLFTTTISLQKGTRYILYLTVNPTYLYMMSEPDLDNPTIEIVGGGI